MPTPSLLIVPARFKTGKLYSQIPTSGAGDFTVTRNTTATRLNSAGLLESVASGIPRLDYYTSGGVTGCPALLVEPSGTNLALQSRDLSQGVWVKTNVTAVKNAVGADGVASGATTLTATAASGTVLQAIVNISQSRVFSAYVRRVTGTGAVEMTTNGGTNWTAVTISSTYTQVACAAQTVLNGSVGFRMAVSGDVIEVDFTQSEVGPAFTSPIPTTAGTGSRSADVISVSGAVSGSIGQTEGTLYAEIVAQPYNGASFPAILQVDDGADSQRFAIFINPSGGIRVRFNASGVNTNLDSATPSVLVAGQTYKIAAAFNFNGSQALYINGVFQASGTVTAGPFTATLNRVMLGHRGGIVSPFLIRSAALYTTRLTNAELASLTAP